jgi:VWFA-related protein
VTRTWPAVLCLALSALPLGAQEQTTFHGGTDAVRVDVSVRDGARVVTGLTARDFVITDNGVAQDVVDVSFGKLPIDVTIALDVSLSVTGPLLDDLRRAILQLLRDLGPEDRLKLVTFNVRITRVLDFTTDATAVEQAIRAVRAGGGTSVWDAVAVSLVSSAPPDRRELVVLFSDATDSTSTLRPGALAEVAKRTDTTLTAVVPAAVTQTGLRGDPGARLATLETLGKETGGSVIPVGADLTATFRRAIDEFRSSYVLHFIPKGVERTGFHELDVNVKGNKKLSVRARRGYVGG